MHNKMNRKNRSQKFLNLAVTCTVLFIFFGLINACASTPPHAAWSSTSASLNRDLDIKIFAGETTASGTSLPFTLSGELLDGATIQGTAREVSGAWELSLTGLKWFNNWPNGWTEAHFVVEGQALLKKTEVENRWQIEVVTLPTIDVPDSGRIRYNESYLRDDNGLRIVSNRWDRIVAATDWLRQQQPEVWFDRAFPYFDLVTFSVPPNFAQTQQAILFPELYGSNEARSQLVGKKNLAESVFWDTDFSVRTFPERLRAVRDSGTLLRDWEESTGLWFLAFVWKPLWEKKLPAARFELKE